MSNEPSPFPISISALDQIELKTPNLSEMIRFYGGILGCEIMQTSVEVLTVRMGAGRSLIDLKDVSSEFSHPDKMKDTGNYNISLQLDTWDKTSIIKHFKSHKIPHNVSRSHPGIPGQECWISVKDPDGNLVKLRPNKNQT